MKLLVNALMGLVVGYVIGILLAGIGVFAFGLEDAARFIAIGCGLLGALLGPTVFGAVQRQAR